MPEHVGTPEWSGWQALTTPMRPKQMDMMASTIEGLDRANVSWKWRRIQYKDGPRFELWRERERCESKT